VKALFTLYRVEVELLEPNAGPLAARMLTRTKNRAVNPDASSTEGVDSPFRGQLKWQKKPGWVYCL